MVVISAHCMRHVGVNCLDPASGVYSFEGEKVLANDVSIKYVF